MSVASVASRRQDCGGISPTTEDTSPRRPIRYSHIPVNRNRPLSIAHQYDIDLIPGPLLTAISDPRTETDTTSTTKTTADSSHLQESPLLGSHSGGPQNSSSSQRLPAGNSTIACSGHSNALQILPPQQKAHKQYAKTMVLPTRISSLKAHQDPQPIMRASLARPFAGDNSIDAVITHQHHSSSGTRDMPSSSHSGEDATKHHLTGDDPRNSSTDVPSSVEQADLERRRAVCQSPTWEAYNQQKQDKKGAKKEKELAAKMAKSQSRKLTKAPPNSFTTSGSALSRSSSKHSRIAPSKTSSAEPPPRPPRSRSNSLSSIIRSSFELRRPSIDDDGFLGGIKLEQHIQQADDDLRKSQARQQKGDDQSDIHPALRTESTEKRNITSQATDKSKLPQPPSQRSQYPPISMRTSPSTTTQSLVSPEAPPMSPHELGPIDRWRSRMAQKLKPAEKEKEGTDEEEKKQTTLRRKKSSPVGHLDTLAKERRLSSPALIPATQNFGQSFGELFQPPIKGTEKSLPAQPQVEEPPAKTPPPPRKSPKRRSFSSADRPKDLPSVISELSAEENNPNAYSKFVPKQQPISEPLDAACRSASMTAADEQKRSIKDAALAAFGKPPPPLPLTLDTTSAEYKQHPYGRAPSRSPPMGGRHAEPWMRHRTSSSNGSMSDDLHSATDITTPNTSRPQSEKNAFSVSPKFGGSEIRSSSASPKKSPPLPLYTEEELDDIQAAALKVRAAIVESANRISVMDRRIQSDLAAQKEQPRPRWQSRQVSDGPRGRWSPPRTTASLVGAEDSHNANTDQAPWPADYLQAARRAAPISAPPPPPKEGTSPLNGAATATTPGLGSRPSTAKTLPERPAPLAPRKPIETEGNTTSPPAIDQFPHPPKPSFSTVTYRHRRYQSDSPVTSTSHSPSDPSPNRQSLDFSTDPVAKMFVECCGCKYYHDLPSKLYEAMVNPAGQDWAGQYSNCVSMTVSCPWCKHGMSSRCCAGLAALVYVKERLH